MKRIAEFEKEEISLKELNSIRGGKEIVSICQTKTNGNKIYPCGDVISTVYYDNDEVRYFIRGIDCPPPSLDPNPIYYA